MSYGKNKSADSKDAVYVNQLSKWTNDVFTKLISNFRFSISLRIMINYWRMLVKSALLIWFIFSCLFFVNIYFEAEKVLDHAIVNFQESLETNTEFEYPFDQKQSNLKVTDSQGKSYISNWPVADQEINFLKNTFDWHLPINIKTKTIFLRLNRNIHFAGQQWQIAFLYNLKQWQLIYLYSLIGLVLIDAFRTIYFLIKSNRLNRAVLQPIEEIAEIARRITVENRNQRINVQGTKNELKDLAIIINELLERLEIAYNSQKQFVSDASHELRTPIAVIQGYANMLERWGKSDPVITDEALAAIVNEASNMQVLVENLLFLARHDKKTWNLSLESIQSQGLVVEIAKETELIAKEHVVSIGKLDECLLDADKNSLKQALRIFADNSIKYTPPRGVICFSCTREGEYVALSVKDNGQGINNRDLNRIFDRFYRSDQARNSARQGQGYGLGLSIARIIVLAHNGRIRVRSTPEVGSEFTILLKEKLPKMV